MSATRQAAADAARFERCFWLLRAVGVSLQAVVDKQTTYHAQQFGVEHSFKSIGEVEAFVVGACIAKEPP